MQLNLSYLIMDTLEVCGFIYMYIENHLLIYYAYIVFWCSQSDMAIYYDF